MGIFSVKAQKIKTNHQIRRSVAEYQDVWILETTEVIYNVHATTVWLVNYFVFI